MSLPPQRIDFINFPVQYGFALPDWLKADAKDESSRFVLGGGSGTNHGHPYVMSAYEYGILPGMKSFENVKHLESMMSTLTSEPHQGRLLSSCTRKCIGSTFLEGPGNGTSTIPTSSPSWNAIKSILNGKEIPVFTTRGTVVEIYSINKYGKFDFKQSFNAFPDISNPSTRDSIELVRPEVMANGDLIISVINSRGRITVWTIPLLNLTEASQPPVQRSSLSIESDPSEITDMVLTVHGHDYRLLIANGTGNIYSFQSGDSSLQKLSFGIEMFDKRYVTDGGSPSTNGVHAKFIKQLYTTKGEPNYFVAGYFCDPKSTQKRPHRNHFISIVGVQKTVFTAIHRQYLDQHVKNISDVEALPSPDGITPGDVLFCYSTDASTMVYRLKFDNTKNVVATNTFATGWPAVVDSSFPPVKLLYLRSVDAVLVVWSNYTTALVDLKPPNRGWSFREAFLLFALLSAISSYIITNLDVRQKSHLQLLFRYYYNFIIRLSMAFYHDFKSFVSGTKD